MRKFSIVLATAVAVLSASSASAQTPAGVPPAPGKFTVSINFGFQAASQDVQRVSTFSLYEEEARVEIAQNDIEGGSFFDIGGNARLYGNFGVGLSYNRVDSKGDGVVNGTIPHPEIFDSPRTLTASASDLAHEEQAVHVYATWFVPFTEKLDFTVSAGPSFFNVRQDFIQTVAFSENPPSFNTVTVDEVRQVTLKENTVGFNFGVDANYALTRAFNTDIGVGAMLRYTRGEADFAVNEGETIGVKAGGFQFGGGLRVRF